MRYELSPNYVPLSLLPLKVGGHVRPAPVGAPPMATFSTSKSIQFNLTMLICLLVSVSRGSSTSTSFTGLKCMVVAPICKSAPSLAQYVSCKCMCIMGCSHRRRRRDKTCLVLSCRQLCSHRRQDSFVSSRPSFQFANNGLFTPPTRTRQNCLVLSVLAV